jgi:hypothetical protein
MARIRGDQMPELSLWNGEPCVFTQLGPERVAAGTIGPYVVPVTASTPAVEPQTVRLAFRRVPSAAVIQEVTSRLAAILDI